MLCLYCKRLASTFGGFTKLKAYSTSNNMPTAVVIVAEGAEEIEAVTAAGVLRRGEVEVTVAGLNGTDPVVGSRNVMIKPDTSLDSVANKEFDAIVLPGGLQGAKNLSQSAKVGEMLKKQEGRGGVVAAICAGPTALKNHGIAKGKKLTSHPVVREEMKAAGYSYQEERVVVDGRVITGRAPGTAIEWGLAIVEALQGKDKVTSMTPMLVTKGTGSDI